MFHATMQVLRFELLRTFTAGRLVIWIGLCLFPSILLALFRIQARGNVPDEGIAVICFFLVPQISCMLGLLLWATPAIGSELESQSWIYLTLRGQGRVGLALGKYLTAVLWTASYGILSAISVSVISGADEMLRLMATMVALVIFSSFSYGALYLLIGAAVYRRATVVAVVYSLILEGIVSWVPATINQFTVSYRLRSLLTNWLQLDDRFGNNQNAQLIFGTESVWFTIGALILYTFMFLSFALFVIRTREYPVQTEA